MSRRVSRPAQFGLFALLMTSLFVGCRPKPKAPPLLDEPVFQSSEGFRFLVPEGWIMTGRGNLPPGPLEKERLLVQYQRSIGDTQAALEVSAADMPDADVSKYLSGPSFSVRAWNPSGELEHVEGGGRPGERYHFAATVNRAKMAKEVTVFRRGGRLYFFTLIFSPTDLTAPEQVRHAIGRISWER